MKRRTFVGFFLLLFINVSFAQWPAVFGTEYYWAYPNHTRETYDKGFLLTLDFESQPNTPYGSCIIKTDINGNQLWRKRIGNSSKHLEIRGIAFDPENNIYITGATEQFDDLRDPFIMKLNPCLEVEWCNIYPSPGLDDVAFEIVYVPQLNTFNVSLYYTRLVDNTRLLNIDTDGNEVWSNYYGNNSNYTGLMPFGLVNSSIDTSSLLYGFAYARIDSTLYFEVEPYWLKVAYDGSTVWEKNRLPDSVFSRGEAREEPFMHNQNSFITGLISAPPENNSQLVQLNYEDGSYEWIKTLYQPDSIVACVLNVCTKFNNNIYTGVQYFNTGFNAEGNGSLQKNDSLGNFIMEAILPVNFTSVIEDICVTHDNKLLISATNSLSESDVMLIKYTEDLVYDSLNTAQLTYDSLCPTTITSGTIELACEIITGLKNQSTKGIAKLAVAPNPADDYTIIYLPETIETSTSQGIVDVTTFRSDYIKNLTIEVVNVNGQKIYSAPWPNHIKEQVLSVTDWNAGLYLIQIRNENRTLATGKLLVK